MKDERDSRRREEEESRKQEGRSKRRILLLCFSIAFLLYLVAIRPTAVDKITQIILSLIHI